MSAWTLHAAPLALVCLALQTRAWSDEGGLAFATVLSGRFVGMEAANAVTRTPASWYSGNLRASRLELLESVVPEKAKAMANISGAGDHLMGPFAPNRWRIRFGYIWGCYVAGKDSHGTWTCLPVWHDQNRPLIGIIDVPDQKKSYAFGKDFYFLLSANPEPVRCRDVTRNRTDHGQPLRTSWECAQVLYEDGKIVDDNAQTRRHSDTMREQGTSRRIRLESY